VKRQRGQSRGQGQRAKRAPRVSGYEIKTWETASTRDRRHEKEQRRRLSYLVADGRDLAMQKLAELATHYERSDGNVALVLEALRWCEAGDCFPKWVAVAIGRPEFSEGRAKWKRAHEMDLRHLVRFWHFKEARKHDLSRQDAAAYVVEMLGPTAAGGSISTAAILQSVKHIRKIEETCPGRLHLTPDDHAWLKRTFPRTPAAIDRECKIAMRLLHGAR